MEVRECHQGPERNKKKAVEQSQDHSYDRKRRRKYVQTTKKQYCTAQIRLRTIVKFPQYKIEDASSVKQQKLSSKKLRGDFNVDETQQELHVLVKICGEHTGHMMGQATEYFQPIDERVINKIHELVQEGVTKTQDIQSHLKVYSKSLTKNPEGRRFFPTDKDVRNHVMLSLNKSRCSMDDQLNLQGLINEWKEKSPEDNFFFQPATDHEGNHQPMLFVSQTKFQRHLLSRYGKEFVLMDSTYKITKYEVQLFLICVATNVGYFSVASFITERETTHEISTALKVLQSWNKTWQPLSFMTDMDHREIGAIESVFTGVQVYTCDFHREQAWQRWLKRKECKQSMDEVLPQRIAVSKTEELYEQEVQILKELPAYQNNVNVKRWLENYWFPEKKRWVYCYRRNSLNVRITTTNGVEAQHKLLKHSYLHKVNSGRTLTAAVKVIVQDFTADAEKKYIKKNLECLDICRQYSTGIPCFLQNKPTLFVQHVLERWNKIDAENIGRDGELFRVLGEDGTNTYTCNMASEVPSCTCLDFEKYRWPCKHMLSVMANYADNGWEFLSQSYTSLPCFNLDETVMPGVDSGNETVMPGVESGNETVMPGVESGNETVMPGVESGNETGSARSTQTTDKQTDSTSVRKQCLNVIKQIQNGIYLVTSSLTLKELLEDLNRIDQKVSNAVPTTSGLPTRAKPPKRNVTKKNTEGLTKEEKALERLWNDKFPNDTPLLQIGPYVLSSNSFKYLKTTLSDEVIDAYMSILVKGRSVLYIDCINGTNIFKGHPEYADLLRREKFELYDYCLAVVNEGGFHWVLFFLSQFSTFLHFISLDRETFNSCQKLQDIGLRYYFAELFLEGKPLFVQTSPSDIEMMRMSIGRRLLNATVTKPCENTTGTVESSPVLIRRTLRKPMPKRKRSSFVYAPKKRMKPSTFCVCNKPDDGRKYWQCERCDQWYHPECIGLNVEDEPETFTCKSCEETISGGTAQKFGYDVDIGSDDEPKEQAQHPPQTFPDVVDMGSDDDGPREQDEHDIS